MLASKIFPKSLTSPLRVHLCHRACTRAPGLRTFASEVSSCGLISIQLSESERESQRLSHQNVQRALEALYEDGMVMLDRAIQNTDEIDQVSRNPYLVCLE